MGLHQHFVTEALTGAVMYMHFRIFCAVTERVRGNLRWTEKGVHAAIPKDVNPLSGVADHLFQSSHHLDLVTCSHGLHSNFHRPLAPLALVLSIFIGKVALLKSTSLAPPK